MDWDSICSILSTVVVKTRSNWEVMCDSIPSGDIPASLQITEMTGMLIEGKISFGVRVIATSPAIRIRMANTVKV
jgi:hypothetical protein